MIDPMLSLAFAVEATPGAYALLLGSGVSRGANIPTGWEVTLDLIRQLAAAENRDCGPNPEAWFAETYHESPSYDTLLAHLCKTPAERTQRLRRYFEPDQMERERGEKLPTAAHKAIARLVSQGFVRVILTTNFDRLLEQAIEEVGVAPVRIYSADDAKGAIPLAHTSCAVIKLHGDYLSTQLKNTPDELATYAPVMDRLLDQVFDEYGLVVCGWSAEYDTALRDAIARCPTRRFSTFWTDRGQRGPKATQLIEQRRAQLIRIDKADAFFRDFDEKVGAIRTYGKQHPLTAAAAGATVARYLADDHERIRLDELVTAETERVYGQLEGASPEGQVTWVAGLQRFEALAEPLLAMHVAGGAFSRREQSKVWARSLTRLANPPLTARSPSLDAFRRYPALLALYAGGIAALARDNFDHLAMLFTQAEVGRGDEKRPVGCALEVGQVQNDDLLNQLPVGRLLDVRLCERLEHTLRPHLKQVVPDDHTYIEMFDRFEYLLALEAVDIGPRHGTEGRPAMGLYLCRRDHRIWDIVNRELDQQRENWGRLQAGLFGGQLERFRAAVQKRAQDEKPTRDRFEHFRG